MEEASDVCSSVLEKQLGWASKAVLFSKYAWYAESQATFNFWLANERSSLEQKVNHVKNFLQFEIFNFLLTFDG